ncbi:MAG: bifunctional diaminohydroxyphosphoribosylaminopyrimidine deaminase/5-amino-6-(5-phosphoribosylamino)uracil reductase RibD [Pseudomonadota bacterium]
MTDFTHEDHAYMAEAVRLARRGRLTVTPNPAVGCVIVRGTDIVGRGWHERAGEPHAEVYALRAAGDAAHGATAYVTLEPCNSHGRTPPCTEALIEAGVARVIYAVADPNPSVDGQGAARLREAGVSVAGGLLADAAEALNPGYLKRMRTGRPRVTLKLGQSLDGAIAMSSGESQWITGSAARDDVQALRAESCAILTGVGTVLADDPALTVRAARFGERPRQPMRVVLDSAIRMSPYARVLREPGATLVIGARSPGEAEALTEAGAQYEQAPLTPVGLSLQGIDLDVVLAMLAHRGVNEVLAECGPRLAGSLLESGLIDRFVFYIAPKLLGSETHGLFATPNWLKLANGTRLEIQDARQVGEDFRIEAAPVADPP